MSDNIQENQPCYWTIGTGPGSAGSSSAYWPADARGANTGARSTSVFATQYPNARVQTIVLVPGTTGDYVTVSDAGGAVVGVFKAGGVETHAWDIGGDVGVRCANGFQFTVTSAGAASGTAYVYWRFD